MPSGGRVGGLVRSCSGIISTMNGRMVLGTLITSGSSGSCATFL